MDPLTPQSLKESLVCLDSWHKSNRKQKGSSQNRPLDLFDPEALDAACILKLIETSFKEYNNGFYLNFGLDQMGAFDNTSKNHGLKNFVAASEWMADLWFLVAQVLRFWISEALYFYIVPFYTKIINWSKYLVLPTFVLVYKFGCILLWLSF